MKRSTLSDLSAKTGYSVTTISRVLNGKADQFRISEKSQKVIMNAVKELDYRPNIAARSLRVSATHTLGLLIPCIENPFFAAIASIVIREAYKYTYPVMVIDTRDNPAEEQLALDTFLSRNVDGIIMVPCGADSSRMEEINTEKPVVLIDRYYENSPLPYVCTDNFRGAYEATRLLTDAGHSHIMCISGVPGSITSQRRVDGYLAALSDAGLEENAFICGNNFSKQNGYMETRLALNSGREFSAIFALSSTNLLGAIEALREHGRRVPEDVSLVSFDDNIYLNYLNPPVTCVAQPVEQIGVAAVKMLMNRILDNGEPVNNIYLPPYLIRRDSVRS